MEKTPVLAGIRGGVDRARVLQVFEMVEFEEPVAFYQLYKTNQNTDDHLTPPKKIGELKLYDSAVVRGGRVAGPYWERGRHVFFELEDETGKIRVAAFEQPRSSATGCASFSPPAMKS